MRASELGIGLTEYVTRLIRTDADAVGLTQYLDGDTAREVSKPSPRRTVTAGTRTGLVRRNFCVTLSIGDRKMPKRPKTGFDKFVESKMKDANFAARYKAAKAEIDAVDEIVRALDRARLDLGMSKADLARSISAKPEIVRRLFTGEGANPTMATVVKLAEALNLRLELVPDRPGRSRKPGKRMSARTAA